jgi:hypothetical protein
VATGAAKCQNGRSDGSVDGNWGHVAIELFLPNDGMLPVLGGLHSIAGLTTIKPVAIICGNPNAFVDFPCYEWEMYC